MAECEPCVEKETVRVVLVRHGESEWNHLNLFSGWYDTRLTMTGRTEARTAAEALAKENFKFDVAFTSMLTRAEETAKLILNKLGQPTTPIIKSWKLNERHYGNLTGLNKAETATKYGEEQVRIWRRGYDSVPPLMEKSNPYYKEITEDKRYMSEPPKESFPMAESLKMTTERTLTFWQCTIVPQLKALRRLLIVAHGNSLRSIIMFLDNLSEEAIMEVNVPTGIPFVYTLDTGTMKPISNGSMKFLADRETLRKAMESVANEGKAKAVIEESTPPIAEEAAPEATEEATE